MAMDEARFGLLGDPYRCWAPKGTRPIVGSRMIREYTYAYAAVSPHDGVMDSLILPFVNTEAMGLFLRTVAQRHLDEFVLMMLDGAGWHTAEGLEVPPNMRLVFLPPYSPELSPPEHIWDHIRENYFGNRVFRNMNAVEDQLEMSLRITELDPVMLQRLTGFDWITSIPLNAN